MAGANFKLRPRPCRESHHGIVLDPLQSELADAPVQRKAGELRLGHVRRKDFHLPAEVVGFSQTDPPHSAQTFHPSSLAERDVSPLTILAPSKPRLILTGIVGIEIDVQA